MHVVDQPDGLMAGLDVDSISGRSPTLTYSRYPQVNIPKNYGKSPLLMGKSTISMAIFNSYVCLPEAIAIKTFQIHLVDGTMA